MRSRFITSSTGPKNFPDIRWPEVALIGRSNVGKSSLLNRLAGAKIAKTSRTPGRTQLINFFEVDGPKGIFTLVDLPGYGFARAPGAVREKIGERIEAYFEHRGLLRTVLLLIDIRREVQDEDLEVFEWIQANLPPHLRGRVQDGETPPIRIVATKADKVSKAQQKPRVAKIAKEFGLPPTATSITSAQTLLGIEQLGDLIGRIATESDVRRC